MGTKIVVDPVTRIEGHLRLEVEVENGIVVNAWTKGTMFRGIEQIVQNRDPRDAIYITERVCGVCMGSHGWTSALALEDAFKTNLPRVARLIRNLLVGSLWLHDHVLHFYHLSALDYLDILAIKDYQGHDKDLLGVKDKIMKLVQIGDTAPFTPRYQPDDYSIKNPEMVTSAVAHYIQALKIQGIAKKMSAILGGKQPHQSSIVLGGVTLCPTEKQLEQFKTLLEEVADFITKIYIPDVEAFATGPLLSLARSEFGKGPGNYLAYGAFPMTDSGDGKLMGGGFISENRLQSPQPVDQKEITEAVTYSWYQETSPAHPWAGATEVDLDKENAYSFIKAPRYNGFATEVGPLARMLVSKNERLLTTMQKYSMQPGTVTRHLARAYETDLVLKAMQGWLEDLAHEVTSRTSATKIHDSSSWEPIESGQGVGLNEAPRGALGHWVKIEDHKIKNYQMVVPTTWNASPRDENGVPGPIEQALIDTEVNPDNPINLVRVIRSFDPCLACAVHLLTPSGGKIVKL
ncbi:nickel-dependent hydrogenase large subunit [Desulfitobacterium sp.]|uniref:nickel-dependent hydrogenase large subunit n=1 Tax=Desulfitobacterium sp. TaxID=49981 RepID=UPI002B21A94D|nr:nickel-dependent hydrogenase large subunit [Desulfitobacterium sp.]MEA4902410.1 nickel-dependent hydrogenase large subunit [Desulfitobacterium sp.]